MIWFGTALIYILPFFALQGFGGAFLKIGDIQGESMDDKHKDEIEVLSWSWGATQPTTSYTTGTTRTASKVSVRDFTFTHEYDKASPMLALGCFNGKHIDEAVFTATRTINGDEIVDYLVITLTDVIVSSIAQSGDPGSATKPVEEVTLNYGKIKFEYRPTMDGKTGSTIQIYWDVELNKGG